MKKIFNKLLLISTINFFSLASLCPGVFSRIESGKLRHNATGAIVNKEKDLLTIVYKTIRGSRYPFLHQHHELILKHGGKPEIKSIAYGDEKKLLKMVAAQEIETPKEIEKILRQVLFDYKKKKKKCIIS